MRTDSDGCGCAIFCPFWLLNVSLEMKCSKERRNLQTFDAVLLTVGSAKASERGAGDGFIIVNSEGEEDF